MEEKSGERYLYSFWRCFLFLALAPRWCIVEASFLFDWINLFHWIESNEWSDGCCIVSFVNYKIKGKIVFLLAVHPCFLPLSISFCSFLFYRKNKSLLSNIHNYVNLCSCPLGWVYIYRLVVVGFSIINLSLRSVS